MAFNAHKVMNGTHGELWVNDEKFADVKAFQCKVEFEKEDIKMCGSMATHTKVLGYSMKGSVTLHKVNSNMIRLIGESIKTGRAPRFTIVSKLADPDADGTERIAIENVSFDDLTLADWESATAGSTECPFSATSWSVIDLV